MSIHDQTPGGKMMSWIYGIAFGLTLFSGMGQMPILKRYYVTSIPMMGWSENFYTLSDLHYLSVAVLLFLFAWRLVIDRSQTVPAWTWGPGSWWGWLLMATLLVTGAAKAIKNTGAFIDTTAMVVLDLTHMGAAMALMFTGLIVMVSHGRSKRLARRRY